MAAALPNNADALVAAVRRDCFLAASDDNWTSSRILAIADDCTLKNCAPALKNAKQDWFAADFELLLVTDQAEYNIPEEAMWSSIENAFLIDKTTGTVSSVLNAVASSNRGLYQATDTQTNGIPSGFYFHHTQMVLVPNPSQSTVQQYSVTVSAYRRPAQLVLTDDVCNVTAVNSVTQTITTTTQPSSWATDAPDPYTSGTPYRLDFYARRTPNTRILADQTMTAGSVTSLTFSPSITASEFASISVGDVVTLRGTSPFPDLPPEAVPYLREMVQKTILTAQTDTQALGVYLQEKQDELTNFLRGMKNRADGSPKKLSQYNAAGARFMRSRRRW